MERQIYISDKDIKVSDVMSFVPNDSSGGVVYFVGHVRDHSRGHKVTHLEFDCYRPMAIKEIGYILDRVESQWPIQKIAVVHRGGLVDVGEIAVIIGVSSAHRQAAFEACSFTIDELKKTVPIWKKEFYEDDSVWVSAHP